MTKKRLFLAVNLSLSTTRRIAEAMDQMRPVARDKGMRIAWVPPENLHVTLKFLGWAAEEVVEAVRDRVRELCVGKKGFELVARGAGAFPNEAGARVLWVGVEDPSGALAALAVDVEKAMERLGFEREGRAYSAHLTIGRVKEGKGAAEVLEPHRKTDFGRSHVGEVVLYESIMKSTGSQYVPLVRVPLERSGRSRGEDEGE